MKTISGMARTNTAIFQYVFPHVLPSNAVRSLDIVKQVSINGSTAHLKDEVAFILGE